jgi:hypothetical protein
MQKIPQQISDGHNNVYFVLSFGIVLFHRICHALYYHVHPGYVFLYLSYVFYAIFCIVHSGCFKTHMIKEQIKDGYMNGQDKEKHMTHRIKEDITCGHDNIKHMTHRMRERNPNGQVKIKRRTHAKNKCHV